MPVEMFCVLVRLLKHPKYRPAKTAGAGIENRIHIKPAHGGEAWKTGMQVLVQGSRAAG